MFQIYGHTTRFADFRVIGPSEIRLDSDITDSPDFIFPKFGVTDLPIFVFTLPDYQELGSKKSADSKKSGSGTTKLKSKTINLICLDLKNKTIHK